MFRKLRNRFLLLNLIIISVMMLLAFTAIFTIMHRNVQADIEMELHRIDEFYGKPNGPRNQPKPFPDGEFGEVKKNPRADEEFEPRFDRSVSLAVVVDEAWNVVSIDSRFDMDDAFYEQAVRSAALEKNNIGETRIDGADWAFTVRKTGNGNRIVFLDVTERQNILTTLIYTFLIVGAMMLVVIFFISRFFANRSIAPVQDAFDKQKQFIADASHELKTPLAIIQTNADVLLANKEETIASQIKWLHYMKSETERMSKLTGDLLYLTRMEDAAEAAAITALFSASEAAENVILTMEAVIFEKRISLEYDIEPNVFVRGNAEQFKQVVMILLDNAIKYTNPEGAIRVILKKQHHDVMLSVGNTGEGIAPEHLDRIFDRFYRTDPSRTRALGGYGLGLSIAKAIVEQHKGKLFAKSVRNEWTTFHAHFPAAS
ncbi:sensor histidine kinase [Paenibacillus puerhi]|uniref:sensor histidine kinase n=1 Tax=Paenibacillus puerhi TaxID=2692622 RepID=UPI00135BCA5B|nr:HAMP domain-containing sensor histidine kinase [Paenibacillus puerhi]